MFRGVPSARERTRWFGTLTQASAVVAGASVLTYARFVEPRSLLVRRFEIAIPRLPREMDGTRIAFLSDFHHAGPTDVRPLVQQAAETIAADGPDLILLGGDFYDQGRPTGTGPDWGCFSRIAPTFAVPGNHDYRQGESGATQIFHALEKSGITVMRNSAEAVEVPGGAIDLIGVDDPYTGRDDFDTADRSVERSERPRILLAHAGLLTEKLPVGAADLILTGHTHGAQIRISPFKQTGVFDIFWWLDKIKDKPISPYRQGMFWVRGSLLYVGNGLGTTTLGVRFLAPPEIALIRLVRGNGHPERSCDSAERYVLKSESNRIWNLKPDVNAES